MLVMLLGGLWHGAAWSYAVWGAWHGVLLLLERLLKGTFTPFRKLPFWSYVKVFFVFSCVTISWLFFKLPEFGQVILYFESIAKNSHLQHNLPIITNVLIYSLPVVAYHLLYLLKSKASVMSFYGKVEFIFYAFLIFLILTNSGSSDEFIYFQF